MWRLESACTVKRLGDVAYAAFSRVLRNQDSGEAKSNIQSRKSKLDHISTTANQPFTNPEVAARAAPRGD